MDLNQVTIETERLRLIPITPKYAQDIFSEYRDPVVQYMNYGPPESLEALQERIKDREVDMKAGLQLFMVVLLKETDEFLGCFVLEDLDQENIEMGGWLKGSAHGHHYGQEATAALKQWADENINYGHILWPCAAVNTPSRKLAESLGGKVQREYVKTTARGTVLPFVDYWIFKADVKRKRIIQDAVERTVHEYGKALKKLSDDILLRQRVCAIILNNKKILLVRDYKADFFSMPGGTLEENEDHTTAMVRELQEEIAVAMIDMKYYFSFDLHNQTYNVPQTDHAYLVTIEGTPVCSSEIRELGWFSKEDIAGQKVKVPSAFFEKLFPKLVEENYL